MISRMKQHTISMASLSVNLCGTQTQSASVTAETDADAIAPLIDQNDEAK
jgi:hypothetical protein